MMCASTPSSRLTRTGSTVVKRPSFKVVRTARRNAGGVRTSPAACALNGLPAPTGGAGVRSLGFVHLGPERVEIDDEAGACRHADLPSAGSARDGVSAVTTQLVDLEAAKLGIDDDVEPDARPRVVAELVDSVAVDVPGPDRRHLHDQVGRGADQRVA